MEEKVIDLTNAQVGDKFIRADGEVVTVVCRYYDLVSEVDWLVIVDKCHKGAMYIAANDMYHPLSARLIEPHKCQHQVFLIHK